MQFSTILLTTLVGAAAALPVTGDSSSASSTTISAAAGSQRTRDTTVQVTLIAAAGQGNDITQIIDVAKNQVITVNENNARDFTGLRLEKGGAANLVRCEGRGDNGATTDPFGIGFGGPVGSDDDTLALGAFILRTVACEFKR